MAVVARDRQELLSKAKNSAGMSLATFSPFCPHLHLAVPLPLVRGGAPA